MDTEKHTPNGEAWSEVVEDFTSGDYIEVQYIRDDGGQVWVWSPSPDASGPDPEHEWFRSTSRE